MILENVQILGLKGLQKIVIRDSIIQSVIPQDESFLEINSSKRILFENALAFPGLINSHEHLDFNLFPLLGTGVYNNYTEWGGDIHKTYKNVIHEISRIPTSLRVNWGIYKNLLNGITSVVNHGKKISAEETTKIINVLENFSVLHSVGGEKYWKIKLNGSAINSPVVIHIGEGIDRLASTEIDTLLKWNWIKRKIIGVHGVAMSEQQAASFHAIIWCPASNHFMFQQTAEVNKLKYKTNILFGTDSTLTASWNLWEQLREARATKMLSDAELFNSLTTTAAKIWECERLGSINNQNKADIVIVENKSGINNWDAFFNVNPETIQMVISKGKIRLFDGALYNRLQQANILLNNFSRVTINGTEKYVYGDLPTLISQIRDAYPDAALPVTVN